MPLSAVVLLLLGCRSATLEGAVSKGPFVQGSTVEVSALGPSLQPTGSVFRTETLDDAGNFSVFVEQGGYFAIEAQGYHFNEAVGTLSESLLTLRSIHHVGAEERQTAHVNLVTHLSYQRAIVLAEEGQPLAAAVAQAESELRTALSVGPDATTPGDPGETMYVLGEDTDANAWLLAVSATVAEAGLRRMWENEDPLDAATQELVNLLSADLADDGTFEEEFQVAVREGEASVSAHLPEIRAALQARMWEIGVVGTIPDFERYVDPDEDGVPWGDDNCPGVASLDQTDSDQDGFGDLCDNCPTIANVDDEMGEPLDRDNDGVGDACDNCPNHPNAEQADGDGDGDGDACDAS